jgi:hypothetical protein
LSLRVVVGVVQAAQGLALAAVVVALAQVALEPAQALVSPQELITPLPLVAVAHRKPLVAIQYFQPLPQPAAVVVVCRGQVVRLQAQAVPAEAAVGLMLPIRKAALRAIHLAHLPRKATMAAMVMATT